jgi:hypothetical protein
VDRVRPIGVEKFQLSQGLVDAPVVEHGQLGEEALQPLRSLRESLPGVVTVFRVTLFTVAAYAS